MSDVLPGLLVAVVVALLVAAWADGWCPPGTRLVGGVVDGRRWSVCVDVEMPDQEKMEAVYE